MGSGYRVFTAGEVLTASNVQNFLQDQAVMVFAGTAARSSAIGTANFEEGMLTYLTDVDKLQVYTGASFADVYPAAASTQGLTLINTTSFSGVASQSINSVFTSTYDNYLVYVTITAVTTATDTDVLFRLRASGSDTTSNYSRHYKTWNPLDGSAVGTGVSNQGEVYWFTGIGTSNPNSFGEMRLFNPNRASVTSLTVNGYGVNNSTSQRTSFGNFQQTGATQFDGFTFYLAGAGTITGKVSVYGYNL